MSETTNNSQAATPEYMRQVMIEQFMTDIKKRMDHANEVLHAVIQRNRRGMNYDSRTDGLEKMVSDKFAAFHYYIVQGKVTDKRMRVITQYVEEIEILLNIDE